MVVSRATIRWVARTRRAWAAKTTPLSDIDPLYAEPLCYRSQYYARLILCTGGVKKFSGRERNKPSAATPIPSKKHESPGELRIAPMACTRLVRIVNVSETARREDWVA